MNVFRLLGNISLVNVFEKLVCAHFFDLVRRFLGYTY